MTIVVGAPEVGELGAVVDTLRKWQDEGMMMQLHPGDIGWFWRFGAEATAAAMRTWSRDGRVLAVGLLDGRDLLRLTTAPDARQDDELARRMVEDVTDPARGILPTGTVYIEAPGDALLRDLLPTAGWHIDEPRAPLHLSLADPVPDPGIRIEVTDPGRVSDRVAVQRAAFATSSFTEDRWRAMAAGPMFADARCLLAYDDRGEAVAAVTVWSAGPGRPGLVEPMGVHRDHRGRGHGRAITVAAATALRGLGSSSALVCTAGSNVGAVATYESAGFRRLPDLPDLRRDG